MSLSSRIYCAALAALCLTSIGAGAFFVTQYGRAAQAVLADTVETRESRLQTLHIGRMQGGLKTLKSGSLFSLFNVYNPQRPLRHYLEYTALLSAAAVYHNDPRDILVIGLAAGAVPRFLHHHYPKAAITCVDFDPEILAVAQEHFDFTTDERMRVVIQDARLYMYLNKDRYDLIVVDAYDGLSYPPHLATLEFYELAKSRLTERGVIAANVASGAPLLVDIFTNTHLAAFGNVDSYRARQAVNSVLVSVKGRTAATRKELQQRMLKADRDIRFTDLSLIGQFLRSYVGSRFQAQDEAGEGTVFTDDYCPVNVLRPPPAYTLSDKG